MRTAESVVLTDCPPGPGRAVDVDLEVARVDVHVDLVGLGQHRDRRRRGVDPALGLGDRHPLDPVGTALVLEAAPGVVALHQEDDLVQPVPVGRARREHLDLPAPRSPRSGCTSSKRSRAKRFASSPPSAPRISTMTLRPSLGSVGSSSSRSSAPRVRRCSPRRTRPRPGAARGRRRSRPRASRGRSRGRLRAWRSWRQVLDDLGQLLVAPREVPQAVEVGRGRRGLGQLGLDRARTRSRARSAGRRSRHGWRQATAPAGRAARPGERPGSGPSLAGLLAARRP